MRGIEIKKQLLFYYKIVLLKLTGWSNNQVNYFLQFPQTSFKLWRLCYNPQEHVTGVECNECKRGYYGLRQDNPAGCSQCYCMGHSTECTFSNYYVDQVDFVNSKCILFIRNCFQPLSFEIVDFRPNIWTTWHDNNNYLLRTKSG